MAYMMCEAPSVQSPGITLAQQSGSCRDFATLFMEACRLIGLAARFVSGYLHCPATEAGQHLKRSPAVQNRLHDGVEGTVAARRDNGALLLLRQGDGALGERGKLPGVIGTRQVVAPIGLFNHASDGRLCGFCVASTRTRIEHNKQGACRRYKTLH
jgi:hypothetical protein